MVFRHLLPSILWTALIILLYGLPGGGVPGRTLFDFIPLDKAAHFSVFLLYGIMVNVAIAKHINLPALCNRSSIYTVLWCVSFGAIMEMIQGTVFVDRTSDVLDVLANFLGTMTGVVIFRTIYRPLNAG